MQINFNVSDGLALKVKRDAKRNGKTLDGVGAAILSDFFKSWSLSERAKFYEKAPNKTTGRKIDA